MTMVCQCIKLHRPRLYDVRSMPLSLHISSGVGVEIVDVRGFQKSDRKCERGGGTCRSRALVLKTDILNEINKVGRE